MKKTPQVLFAIFIIIVIIAGCNATQTMVPKEVMTTNNGVITTNIVMVKKFNEEYWAAFFEALADALEDVDFSGIDFDE